MARDEPTDKFATATRKVLRYEADINGYSYGIHGERTSGALYDELGPIVSFTLAYEDVARLTAALANLESAAEQRGRRWAIDRLRDSRAFDKFRDAHPSGDDSTEANFLAADFLAAEGEATT